MWLDQRLKISFLKVGLLVLLMICLRFQIIPVGYLKKEPNCFDSIDHLSYPKISSMNEKSLSFY